VSHGAVILAAGASSRLGVPKQLVRWQKEALLARSIRVAIEAGCHPVVVVLGAYEAQIRSECDLSRVIAVSNPRWTDGMGRSLSLGIAALSEDVTIGGAMVMTCDMPAVSAGHLLRLAASGKATASHYADRTGVPAYFPREDWPALHALRGPHGARDLLAAAVAIPLPGGDLDVDTPDDLRRLHAMESEDTNSIVLARCGTGSVG
jgi:molybdenum cofactor cytidylyltransferase